MFISQHSIPVERNESIPVVPSRNQPMNQWHQGRPQLSHWKPRKPRVPKRNILTTPVLPRKNDYRGGTKEEPQYSNDIKKDLSHPSGTMKEPHYLRKQTAPVARRTNPNTQLAQRKNPTTPVARRKNQVVPRRIKEDQGQLNCLSKTLLNYIQTL